MTGAWPKPPRLVVLTGPGLARESGFAPFDPAALPPGLALADLLTEAGFARDPARVQEFYNARRRELVERIAPNPAHAALAALDLARPGEMLVVTRNLDDLHERAGASAVVHTHGELLKARCTICTKISDRLDDIAPGTECPVCGNAGHLRPQIVGVGEEPLRMAAVYEALAQCALLLAIGSAGGNEPGRSFLAAARRAGARALEFAAAPGPGSDLFDESRHGPLAESVPEYVKALLAAGR